MYYYLKDNSGITVISNLPDSCFGCMEACNLKSQLITCTFDGMRRRQGLVVSKRGTLYLCSEKDIKSSKIFKSQQKIYLEILSSLADYRQSIRLDEVNKFERLKHNLVSYNAHILNNIHAVYSEKGYQESGHTQVKEIQDIL